ncbi:MAG: hypothetical protein ABIE74_03010 [Pseudomonadota bacterium]
MKFFLIFPIIFILLAGCARSRAIQPYSGEIKSLKAFATFKISGADWTRRFDAAILVYPPNRFRVDFFDPIGNSIFSAGFDGKRGWGLRALKNTGLDLEPAEFAKVLLGEKVEGLEVSFLNYKKHKGISFPHEIELGGLKKNVSVEILFRDVDLNNGISDERFRKGEMM